MIARRNPIRRTSINFRLTEEVRFEVDMWAKGEGRTRSDMARILIDEALTARAKRVRRRTASTR
jgi:hypothetical protein